MFDRTGLQESAKTPFGADDWLAAIVRSSEAAIMAWDREGRITCWNHAATEILGHAPAAMIGSRVHALIPQDRLAGEEAILARAALGDIVTPFQTMRIAGAGHEVPVTISMTPVRDTRGVIMGVSGVMCTPGDYDCAANDADFADDALGDDHSILIVEDEVLTGLGLIATLENAGFRVIGPARNVRAGMELLDRHRCELAILDINLGDGETSAPLAERLKEAGIPFFVTSGYSAHHNTAIFNDAPNFPKPVPARVIVTAVREALQ